MALRRQAPAYLPEQPAWVLRAKQGKEREFPLGREARARSGDVLCLRLCTSPRTGEKAGLGRAVGPPGGAEWDRTCDTPGLGGAAGSQNSKCRPRSPCPRGAGINHYQ